MAGNCLPLAAFLVATAATIVVATSAVPVAAAAADKYSGRMVIIRAPGASRRVVVSAAGALNKQWQLQRRRLVEDEVAPEFGGLLGAGNGGSVGDAALNKDRANCLPSGECTKPGGSYSRGCTYEEKCPH